MDRGWHVRPTVSPYTLHIKTFIWVQLLYCICSWPVCVYVDNDWFNQLSANWYKKQCSNITSTSCIFVGAQVACFLCQSFFHTFQTQMLNTVNRKQQHKSTYGWKNPDMGPENKILTIMPHFLINMALDVFPCNAPMDKPPRMAYPSLAILCTHCQATSIHCLQDGHLVMWPTIINLTPPSRK